MKRYRITSIIYAKNIIDAVKKSKEAEIIDIELNEELHNPYATKEKLGFK